MGTARRKEIVEKIADELGAPRYQAESVLNTVLDSIKTSLANGDKVVLTGFGSFSIRKIAARKIKPIRGIDNGELVDIPAHNRIGFTPGSGLNKLALNLND
ncbi:MAG: HU family DNA-binding protein [SAR202 cluster bacterium]|nr:HU family DNA-binding protein [SAR202 cluster bacterium]|tara:strand:- start:1286 stop:1588 length:303 start_codon:yes stop_codon:yes gene_type:complete